MTDQDDVADEARHWREHADDYARLLLELADVEPADPYRSDAYQAAEIIRRRLAGQLSGGCARCGQSTVAALRPKAVECDGRLVVVRDVPVDMCDACGQTHHREDVAVRLDRLIQQLIAGGAEVAVGRYVDDGGHGSASAE